MAVLTLLGAGAVLALLPWQWVLAGFVITAVTCLAVYLFGTATILVPLLLASFPFVLAGWLSALSMWILFNRMRSV